jgi:hypothetical protein
MHARHAIDRITGEWFALNETQLSDAYLLAQKLAKNLEKHLPGLQRVEQIASMLSTEEDIKPDSTLLDIHEVYKTNATELMAVEDELKEIKETLRDFAKNTGGINGVAGWRISSPPAAPQKWTLLWRCGGPSARRCQYRCFILTTKDTKRTKPDTSGGRWPSRCPTRLTNTRRTR